MRGGLILAILLMSNSIGQAQFGELVYDPKNWLENFTTAIETVKIVKNQLADLASLSDLTAVGNVLASSQRLMGHAQRIGAQLRGRNAQWAGLMDMGHFTSMDPQGLPEALEVWNQQASGLMGTCATEAMVAQQLLEEAGATLQDVSAFIGGIAALSGSVQGLQTLAGTMATAAGEITRMSTLAGTFHQAMLNENLLSSVNEQVSGLLARERLKDWPMDPLLPVGN